ncbi:hypothetical protein FHR84_002508 [Actinopolyspora biskrensis]|uniref:Uncharacterized protein n=1 Tax=Actinopolyspora biskrensis TaxID=1470178 RepID=A0A852YVK5_9ACTN|nr:hypothetical protein [Actinopolyspora biskrensis]
MLAVGVDRSRAGAVPGGEPPHTRGGSRPGVPSPDELPPRAGGGIL